MKHQDWEMLDVLLSTENITKAAEHLYLSQPTLTSRIRKLEAHYNVPLILRKQRGITFTPEGEVLAQHARKMLEEQIKIEEDLNNLKKEVAGTLRIGASNFFALNKMPKLLSLFKQQYPDVEFQVVTGWSKEMYRNILNQDVHISFISGDYSWKDKKELLYEESVCVAAPWEFQWEDLPTLPRIEYSTDDKMRYTIDDWWYSNYKHHPKVSIQVHQVEACREMVLNGLGYAILADLPVSSYPDLVTKPLKDASGNSITRSTSMYFHNDSLRLNVVDAFVNFVRTLDLKNL
ncbi:LysR family transcriptional regulator [Salinicoccus kekensis]|uniref:DNA-binding transcriptional LysR family regulator n=1 Tax=Salinicoccus kekensis TaxID=714307 RepID=A0A285UFN3_9STAP|nr:LysR family transcriptional regulator [Salinicoccus kekensis]SOC40690.1 DNA-binding transcriptional LysR family regulator [Salinicoccus kekensis]